jgi:iron complex outermembrane receptor protein
MKTKNLRFGGGAIAVAAALATGSTAFAQQTTDDEIVVTAQRRAENIQDVPASISAFTAESIRELNVQNVGDIADAIPNVIYQDNGLVARFNIRGITLNDTSEGNESPIGLYIDNSYFGYTGAGRAAIFDIERVEVLRGPQGTLYGRNTTGGLTHFISAEPTEELSGYASLQYGRFNSLILEGAISGQIVPGLRARLSLKSNTDDGFQENVAPGPRNGEAWGVTDELSGRLQFAADLGDATEVLLNLHATEADGTNVGYGHFGLRDPSDPVNVECSVSASLSGACEDFAGFRDPNADPTRIYSNIEPGPNQVSTNGGFVRITHDFGAITLTSQTSFENAEKLITEDADSSPNLLAEGTSTLDGQQFTQELRLNGEAGNSNWVLGLFYYQDDRDAAFFIEPGAIQTNHSNLTTDSIALYGDIQHNLTERLTLSAGLRYTRDDREHTGWFDDFFGFSGNQIPFSFDLTDESVTGRLVLSYDVSDDVMWYASVSTGAKSPAFNTLIATSDPDPNQAAPSDPEEITAYEIGFRSQLLDRRLRLNASAFVYDYRGMQQTFSPPGERTPRLANIDSADIRGLEIEATFNPIAALELSAILAFNDNEISSPGTVFDGNSLATSPETSYRVGAAYDFELGTGGILRVAGDYRWQDDVFFAPDNDPFETQQAYGIANAVVSWRPASGAFMVEAFGDNLFDEEYFSHSFAFRGFGGMNNAVWGRPLTYGVRVRADF